MSAAQIEALLQKEFFQVVRLLQRQTKEYPKIGYANLPKDEAARFGQAPSLAFPSSLIDSIEPPSGGRPVKIRLSHHGLLGSNGPLPLNYTEYAQERVQVFRDSTMLRFLDVFHHRMMSLLARAWADNNIAVDMDRPEESHFRRYVACLVGLGQESLQGRDVLPDNARLYFSGWLSRGPRSPEGLAKILGDFFEARAEVLPFQGRWLPIPRENRSRLAGPKTSGIMGQSLILGETVWDCGLSLRVLFGPLKYRKFSQFMPGGLAFKQLCCWVKSYAGDAFFWDVAFDVESGEIPTVQLGHGARLGYNSWIGGGESTGGIQRVVFEGQAA